MFAEVLNLIGFVETQRTAELVTQRYKALELAVANESLSRFKDAWLSQFRPKMQGKRRTEGGSR